MASYFNRTNGPLSVTLRTGETGFVAKKGTLVVSQEQDGSSSMVAAVRKGHLVPLKVTEPEPVVVPVVPVVAEEAPPAPVVEPVTVSNEVSLPAPESEKAEPESTDDASKASRRKR